jgi:DNA-binding response OmpR family regulator
MILKPHFTVFTAESRATALEILKHTPIDLMTLDLRMPGGDGIGLLREVRKTHPELPVIIITGHASLETAVDGLRSEVLDYLTKPVDVRTLLNAVRKGIEKRRVRAKLEQLNTGFLSSLEHHLRTPLSSVLGFSSLLREEMVAAGEQHRVLERIHTNSEELLQRIDDVLCLAAIAAGEAYLVQESCRLPGIVSELLHKLHGELEREGLLLSLTSSPQVPVLRTDRDRLERVMRSLVRLAATLTRKGSLTVAINPLPNQDWLEVCVAGIPTGPYTEEAGRRDGQPEAFCPFRASSVVGSQQLTLDALMVEKVTEFLGGQVEVKRGRETVLRLKLPCCSSVGTASS